MGLDGATRATQGRGLPWGHGLGLQQLQCAVTAVPHHGALCVLLSLRRYRAEPFSTVQQCSDCLCQGLPCLSSYYPASARTTLPQSILPCLSPYTSRHRCACWRCAQSFGGVAVCCAKQGRWCPPLVPKIHPRMQPFAIMVPRCPATTCLGILIPTTPHCGFTNGKSCHPGRANMRRHSGGRRASACPGVLGHRIGDLLLPLICVLCHRFCSVCFITTCSQT